MDLCRISPVFTISVAQSIRVPSHPALSAQTHPDKPDAMSPITSIYLDNTVMLRRSLYH
jgi:hypothetical protein